MAYSEQQVKEAIDRVCSEYGERQIKRLINATDISVNEIYELRGKAAATRDLRNLLVDAIGN